MLLIISCKQSTMICLVSLRFGKNSTTPFCDCNLQKIMVKYLGIQIADMYPNYRIRFCKSQPKSNYLSRNIGCFKNSPSLYVSPEKSLPLEKVFIKSTMSSRLAIAILRMLMDIRARTQSKNLLTWN